MYRGIEHDIPFINIRKVPREVLKTEGEDRGFQLSRRTLRMLMNDKIMFLNLNLNSLLVKRQVDNPSPGAVTGGN